MTLKGIIDLVTNILFIVALGFMAYYKRVEAKEAKNGAKNKFLADMEQVASSYVHSIAQTDFSGREKMKGVINAVETYFDSKGHKLTPEEHALIEGMAQKAYDKMKLDDNVREASETKMNYSGQIVAPTPENVTHETSENKLTPASTYEGMRAEDEHIPTLAQPSGENGTDAQNLANNDTRIEREG